MSFCKEDDLKLIELVEMQRELYDPTHKDYKDVMLRNNIWANIALHLTNNKTGKDCKKRWRSIRDTWKRLKKTDKLDTSSKAHTKRSWLLVPYLEFLNNVPPERITVRNVTNAKLESELNDEEEKNFESVSIEGSIVSETEASSTNKIVPKSKINTLQKDNLSRLLRQSKQERDKLTETIYKNNNLQEDEIDLFYKSLAMSVKKLPRHLRSQAKLRSLQVVTELENQATNQELLK
ncbi:hypothetical protein RN001_007949 [Aquatica leii]|uniref:Transcription factor Adf-1 n=1 Tax=Aquatica leii TaxID=1421715 RepID=A0AAN7PA62_9COLE|nr:hypothetical protein RN001_007949 [Aquatica leii]